MSTRIEVRNISKSGKVTVAGFDQYGNAISEVLSPGQITRKLWASTISAAAKNITVSELQSPVGATVGPCDELST